MNGIIPDTDQGHLASAAMELYAYACEVNTPANIYRPRLFVDGDQWCALLGENIQDGVCGFGKNPAAAYADFNRNWYRNIPAPQAATSGAGDPGEGE